MKQFLTKTFLLLFPVIIFFLPPFLILKKSGENFKNIDSILKGNEPYLIGYIYNEENYKYLKWSNIKIKKKQHVLALGSSRVLQFRDSMFNHSFYNAGYTISKMSDFKRFLLSVPKIKYPEYLLIGLDQWMFNKNWDSGINSKTQKIYLPRYNKYPNMRTYFDVYKNLLSGKFNLNDVYEYSPINKIGLNAVVNNTGFRNDGSMFYGTQIKKLNNNDKSAKDYMFENTFERIKNGDRRFQYGKNIDQNFISDLEDFLIYCKQNNIIVIGFLPPFANEVNDMLLSKNYEYMKKIYPTALKLFSKYNYEFYDYSSLKKWNLEENEFIDGFHGSDVIYARITLDMLKRKSILNEVSDSIKLNNDIANRKNKLQLYNDYNK